jgi:hypothetical protein
VLLRAPKSPLRFLFSSFSTISGALLDRAGDRATCPGTLSSETRDTRYSANPLHL